MSSEIKFENMVVYFVCVLIEATKCIYLVVTAVCYRGVDQACRSVAHGPCHLGPIGIDGGSAFGRRVGHDVCII